MRILPLTAMLILTALPLRAEEITVFAAASLRNAMDQVAATYIQKTGDQVTLSYAGSSALARQIGQGAPADLYLSASVDWMDNLEAQALVRPETRVDLLGNRLVVVAHAADGAASDNPAAVLAALGEGRLAVGAVDAVPAGIYARQALTALGLWPQVQGRLAQADDVRKALALVALGEAPLGIVYATDAAAEPRVHVVATFPEGSHDPIIYPAAIPAEAPHPDAAQAFLSYLTGDAARALFEAQGFTVLDQKIGAE